jgi:hypothetical protein
MLIVEILPTASDVFVHSREQIAGCILEHLNAEAENNSLGENAYQVAQATYLGDIETTYQNRDVTDRFTFAWRWLIDTGYISEMPGALQSGWYRLTATGREIKKHEDLQAPRVPRRFNPGPAPDFRSIADPSLAQHLHVLWEEGVMCYNGEANLSTVIMLGSLLEAALLAKCLQNDAQARASAHAPRQQGRVKSYGGWTLNDFLGVAEDNAWIHQSRNDFADTLRGYRNMVHPYNAFNQGYFVDRPMATICWEVVRATLGDLGVKI